MQALFSFFFFSSGSKFHNFPFTFTCSTIYFLAPRLLRVIASSSSPPRFFLSHRGIAIVGDRVQYSNRQKEKTNTIIISKVSNEPTMPRPPEKNTLPNETQLDPTQKNRSQHPQEQKQGKEEIPCFRFAHESESQSESTAQLGPNSLLYRIWSLVTYTPHRCRWDPANPVKFSWALTVLFGFATTFTVSCSFHFFTT